MHPRELRCSSFKYDQYSQSSRLARGAPRRPRCTSEFATGPLARIMDRPSAIAAQLRVAISAALLLTKYCWLVRRGRSPAELARAVARGSPRRLSPAITSMRVVGIVSRVAAIHPLRPACLEQALTSCHLMTSAGRTAAVRLGVARPNGTLNAHAWVDAPDIPASPNASFTPLGDLAETADQ
jgi:hypothetical protein